MVYLLYKKSALPSLGNLGPYVLSHRDVILREQGTPPSEKEFQKWAEDAVAAGAKTLPDVVDYLVKKHSFVRQDSAAAIVKFPE